jgi:hypothetical protein
MHRRHVARTVAGTAAVLACAVALSACRHDSQFNPVGATGNFHSAVAAAKGFITEGVIDNNGSLACGYLTSEQQRAASKRADGGECRQAFDGTDLTLGREHVNTVSKVRHLKADATVSGNQASVTLSRRGDSIEFRLVKASAADEETQFQPPDTQWRIAAGGVPFIFADPHWPCQAASAPCASPR